MTVRLAVVANSEVDQAMLCAWDEGLSTWEIARLMQMQEHDVERRLWQLREKRRANAKRT